MRPINARGQALSWATRQSSRTKTKSRTSARRGGVRARSDFQLPYGGELRERFGRLRNIVIFRRPMLSLTVMLVWAGGITGLIAGGHLSRLADSLEAGITGAGFAVDEIVVAGAERTSATDAYAALGIEQGQSIFAVDVSEARARLLDLPWVADAEVRRALPGTVRIRLVEKRPFALWRNGQSIVVIERSGAVITELKAGSLDHLPLFSGSGAPEAAAAFLDVVRPYRAVFARLQTIRRMGERRWDLLLAGGVTVRLPEEGWEGQLAELEGLIVDKAILERDIEMIDLRYPDNYVFRLHNGDSRPVSRERRA
jgi:cell division protein FtsQ